MEKKFYVVQEREAGRFAVLSTRGFRPMNENYIQLTFDEITANAIACAFIEECGRKCWIEEVK